MRRKLSLGCAVGILAALGPLAGSALADGGPIMPLSEVAPGMQCIGETVVQGTTISSFDVNVINVVEQAGQGPMILVSVSGPVVAQTGVVEGFSGSPIYCPDSSGTMENAGAISQSVEQYGNNIVLATPIQQMLGEPVFPPEDLPQFKARTRPLSGPLMVGGLSPALLAVLERAGRRAGRTVLSTPAQGSPAFPPQQLVPGASVGVQYSTGEISSGAIGTVTYTNGQTVYAFGHELDGAGRRSLLLDDAYVYAVIADPNPADSPPGYKLAVPGHALGTLTSDTPSAVIGVLGQLPTLIPVDVTAHDLDTGATISEDSQVADEMDIGQPLGTSMLDTVAPLAVGQAAVDVYDGAPADESGSMCLRITIAESAKPMGFCRRYVGIGGYGEASASLPELANGTSTDVSTALGVLDRVAFAALHVTGIQATINAQRGLAEASIVGATAPLAVHAGRRIVVRLRVRVFRGALRTVPVRIRVPRHARGPVLVSIRGPAFSPTSSQVSGSSGSLQVLLTGSLSGGSSSGPTPQSIAQVRSMISALGTYDGLSASFNGGRPRRIFRDPSLLISGRTTVPLDVR